jgi:DNA-binding MarR family transcriptional regulator
MTPNEVRALVGLTDEQGGGTLKDVAPSATSFKFSEDDVIDIFAQFGESKSNYSIFRTRDTFSASPNDLEEAMNLDFATQELTRLEANVLDLIQKDKRITPEIIAGTIKTDLGIINKIMDSLEERGLIKSTNVRGNTERVLTSPLAENTDTKPSTRSFMVRYSYEWRSSIPGGERNSASHPSRQFCARLMQLDKLYTRAEIEAISLRLGYSVFDRRGGWWTMPDGDHSPSCRHVWASQVVIKKG